ncbi:MAG: hypothetical protein U1F43_00735 [Myxococcota bacterium]
MHASSLAPPTKGEPTAAERIDASYAKARAHEAPARWLRGPDGRGKELPQIDVPAWKPGEPMADPIGLWLREGRTP